MNNKILRMFLCVLVVLCLLVNLSPIRAEAVVAESVLAYYALGLAAALILNTVGVVYTLNTTDEIVSLGRNWDTFMTDGSSALDYDLEDWEEYKTATIIQFTPESDPANDDDFPDDYDPNKIRIKTLESALNVGLCLWLESFIKKTNSLITRPSVGEVSFYGCGELIPARTHVASPFPTADYETSPDDNSAYTSCYWADVDCYLYCYTFLTALHNYDLNYVFVPVDSTVTSFTLYQHTINKYIDSSTVRSNGEKNSFTLENGDEFSYYAASTGGTLNPAHCTEDWLNLMLPSVHIFDSWISRPDAMRYLMFESLPKDITTIVPPSVITGPVSGAVANGFSVSDLDLPDIEYGAIILDPSDPETSIKENQQQITNGDKTYDDYIGQVAPGHTVVVPDPIEPPETEPTAAPDIEPTEFPGVEPNPDSGSDANPSWLQSLFDGLWDLLQRLADLILNGIKSIFVPSEDYVTSKVDALRENFGFIDSIIMTGEYIRDSISGASGPPTIYVDLSAADGDTNWGDKVLLTDFSWYAPYKSKIDFVLSAALWAFFGWRVFMRLPGIISGESGFVGDVVSRRDKSKKE